MTRYCRSQPRHELERWRILHKVVRQDSGRLGCIEGAEAASLKMIDDHPEMGDRRGVRTACATIIAGNRRSKSFAPD
jgi:hypothetical protein